MIERKKLGELLVEAGLISDASLKVALNEQRRWGGTLGRMLVEMKLLTEAELVRVLSGQLGLPAVELDQLAIPAAVIALVPAELARQHSIIPFAMTALTLDLALADPSNLAVIEELHARTQRTIRPHLAGPRVIERAIARHYAADLNRPGPRRDGTAPSDIANVDKAAAVEVVRQAHLASNRELTITTLQERIAQLEAQVARADVTIAKLIALIVDKGVASREEIEQRIG